MSSPERLAPIIARNMEVLRKLALEVRCVRCNTPRGQIEHLPHTFEILSCQCKPLQVTK